MVVVVLMVVVVVLMVVVVVPGKTVVSSFRFSCMKLSISSRYAGKLGLMGIGMETFIWALKSRGFYSRELFGDHESSERLC